MAAGVACGVRDAGRRDLGLLFSELPCETAAVFTRNAVKGAPLGVTREAVETGGVRAVVANSGNANAATGERGIEDARVMQDLAAEALEIEASEVAVASTGVIGVHLPMGRISSGIWAASGKLGEGGAGFAESILTTDTRVKEAVVRIEIGGRTVTVGGTAKGSGMIHPNMGTMLAFLTTDAAVEKSCLTETLNRVTDRTFNRVTVDGDTSPSDIALLMANGAAGNEPLTPDSPDYPIFAEAVEGVARTLAKEIARDGEGATRLVEVAVEGAASEESAAALAKSVVGSSLVKAAVFGEDANWGRVLTAMGYSGVAFDPDGVELWFGPIKVFSGGEPVPHEEAEANAALAAGEVKITARLGEGNASATAWGCDLSYEYVRINGSYRT
ncbi:MAG: bifunctional glutamate N-acetyltransferase/amino-acid acetyltransferase ArgJ [Actinomycetota bacterium]|jgi:glutamate N-acetyltransferase/amino-acid N-acetyltransferase|nr:bifunctional glutamate N-acetyltransferase/amino-acid acetyltransferase ArgJ [Actinomycetota bacterium]MDQ3363287.1 bifunctional glutamate N-acetyltransferase/amino-acid acetyltransferase ArgJ [Actinomycetota bacterium]MDQ3497366.1 bifunctional glutamate N-acetyltransferase/amino-acid acetyltransferase ArgJ [Actinomycetota bacterium]